MLYSITSENVFLQSDKRKWSINQAQQVVITFCRILNTSLLQSSGKSSSSISGNNLPKTVLITGKWQVFLRNIKRMHFNATDFTEEES